MCSSGLDFIVIFDNMVIFEMFTKYIWYLLKNGA